MAIERIGSTVTIESSTNASGVSSESITVPTDCTCVVVSYAHYVTDGADATSMSINGASLTKAISLAASSGFNGNVGMWYLVNPSTGAQTITVQWNWATGYYCSICLTYLKGVDTTTPARDSDTQIAPSAHSTYQTITSDAIDYQDGDLALVAVFDNGTSDGVANAAPTGAGQTSLATDTINSATTLDIGYKELTGSGTTTMKGTGNYPAICAVVWAVLAGQTASPALGAATVSGTTATLTQHQHALPSADRTDGTWLNASGNNTNLYASIGEASYDDATYIVSNAATTDDTCTVDLGAIDVPDAGTVTIRIRAGYV